MVVLVLRPQATQLLSPHTVRLTQTSPCRDTGRLLISKSSFWGNSQRTLVLRLMGTCVTSLHLDAIYAGCQGPHTAMFVSLYDSRIYREICGRKAVPARIEDEFLEAPPDLFLYLLCGWLQHSLPTSGHPQQRMV